MSVQEQFEQARDQQSEAPVVMSKDARYDPLEGAKSMLADIESGEVVAVSLVGITSTGAVRVIASESTGQTLNMLAQAIQKIDSGEIAEDDTEES